MQLLVWQLVDSAFPSGGFAHSSGLEAAMRHGLITDGIGVRSFARQAIAQAGYAGLPLVSAAYREADSLAALDELADAFLSNAVANRASRAQGRALLTSTARSFPASGIDRLEDRVRRDRLCAHYAPLFGRILQILGIDLADTRRLFLFLVGRGVGAAAIRLGLTGAFEAQELQSELAGEIDRVIDACDHLEPLDISQTSPLIDLCQSTHDRLYSRLFQS